MISVQQVVRWYFLALLGFMFLSPTTQAAPQQDPMQGQKPVPMVAGEFRFVPGSWGIYKLKSADDPQDYKMYFAILDEVKQRKGKAYWMEIEMYTNDHPAVVTKILVPDTGDGPGDVLKAYVQLTGYRPFEVPGKYLKPDPKKKQDGVGQFEKYDLAGQSGEKEIIWKGRKLKATTTDTTDAQGKPTSVTISTEAPPLCVVKMNSPQVQMELLDWGTDAKTKMIGKPVGLWRWVWGVAVTAAAEGESAPAN